MSRPVRTLLAWSSGKDAAFALHELRLRGEADVVGLLTTVNQVHDRVAMHGVRHTLLRAQAVAAGLPLWEVTIPSPCSNAEYEAAMAAAMERARGEDVDCVAFGDLFLDDVRRYREDKLAPTGIHALFPLWGRPTQDLARAMIAAGLRARVVCVDPRKMPAAFAGREFDAALLADLPTGVDPCGENGEFHTFAYAGPMFAHPIAVQSGVTVERDGFVFHDLQPVSAG